MFTVFQIFFTTGLNGLVNGYFFFLSITLPELGLGKRVGVEIRLRLKMYGGRVQIPGYYGYLFCVD